MITLPAFVLFGAIIAYVSYLLGKQAGAREQFEKEPTTIRARQLGVYDEYKQTVAERQAERGRSTGVGP